MPEIHVSKFTEDAYSESQKTQIVPSNVLKNIYLFAPLTQNRSTCTPWKKSKMSITERLCGTPGSPWATTGSGRCCLNSVRLPGSLTDTPTTAWGPRLCCCSTKLAWRAGGSCLSLAINVRAAFAATGLPASPTGRSGVKSSPPLQKTAAVYLVSASPVATLRQQFNNIVASCNICNNCVFRCSTWCSGRRERKYYQYQRPKRVTILSLSFHNKRKQPVQH